jgi:glycosyltransferase involved in cell wall biosynthesis
MEFSVVVPFFNAEKFIERCAQALLTQTLPPDRYEILMVDNNSQDSSASIVRRFDRVRLLQEAEQGSYAARNRGIDAARGEIVAFTDPDCVPRKDWLEQIGRAMAQPHTALVLGGRQFATDSGILGMLAAYESGTVARIFAGQEAGCYFGYTNNMSVRMSIVKAIGGFQKLARGADTLFLRRVAELYGGSALQYNPDAMVRHLEIARVRDYLRKKTIYGQVRRRMDTDAPGSLPLATRVKLALRANGERGGSLADRIAFFGILAAGAIRFEWCAARRRAIR